MLSPQLKNENNLYSESILYTPNNQPNEIIYETTTKIVELNKNIPIGKINNEWEPESINLFSRGRKQNIHRLSRDVPYYARTISTWHNFTPNQNFGFGQVQSEKLNTITKLREMPKNNLTIDVTADRVIIYY